MHRRCYVRKFLEFTLVDLVQVYILDDLTVVNCSRVGHSDIVLCVSVAVSLFNSYNSLTLLDGDS